VTGLASCCTCADRHASDLVVCQLRPSTKPAFSLVQYVSKATGAAKDGAQEFLENVQSNTKQYLKLFAEAADDCLPEPSLHVDDDVYDVLQAQARFRYSMMFPAVVRIPSAVRRCKLCMGLRSMTS
jgi:hypothetical protein